MLTEILPQLTVFIKCNTILYYVRLQNCVMLLKMIITNEMCLHKTYLYIFRSLSMLQRKNF